MLEFIPRIKGEKLVGLLFVLALHGAALYGLWSYRLIPPPDEVITLMVNLINPPPPEQPKPPKPEPPKPEPPKPELPKPELPKPEPRPEEPPPPPPEHPHLAVEAPVVSPSEPVTYVPPPVPAVEAPPSPPQPVIVAPPPPVHAVEAPPSPPQPVIVAPPLPQPVVLSGELSVSCPERSPPNYPKQSTRLNEQGRVVVRVELGGDGRVANASVKTSSGYRRLDDAALDAVRTWRCKPAMRNGIAVAAIALQPFNFTLEGR